MARMKDRSQKTGQPIIHDRDCLKRYSTRSAIVSALLLGILTLGGGVILGRAGQSFASTPGEIREKIEELLRDRHPSEKPDWWRALGPEAPSVIISMYENSSHTYHRIRLLQGLGWFDTPQVTTFLKRQAERTQDDVIRDTAIRSIGFSQGAKETDFIAEFLENSNPQTRYTAAETLRRFNDARANELVEKYLKKEKVSWISPKLRGVLPRPTTLLTPVASSEDRLALDFSGDWRGYWISPRGVQEKGMKSEPIFLQIKPEGQNSLKAQLRVKDKKRERTLKLERVTGKASRITGVMVSSSDAAGDAAGNAAAAGAGGGAGAAAGAPPIATPSKEELPFEADLLNQAGSWILEFRLRKSGAFLILRRDPVVAGSE